MMLCRQTQCLCSKIFCLLVQNREVLSLAAGPHLQQVREQGEHPEGWNLLLPTRPAVIMTATAVGMRSSQVPHFHWDETERRKKKWVMSLLPSALKSGFKQSSVNLHES